MTTKRLDSQLTTLLSLLLQTQRLASHNISVPTSTLNNINKGFGACLVMLQELVAAFSTADEEQKSTIKMVWDRYERLAVLADTISENGVTGLVYSRCVPLEEPVIEDVMNTAKAFPDTPHVDSDPNPARRPNDFISGTENHADHQLIEMQNKIISDQNAHLENLSMSVRAQHSIGLSMASELERQSHILDNTERGLNAVDRGINRSNTRMQALDEGGGGGVLGAAFPTIRRLIRGSHEGRIRLSEDNENLSAGRIKWEALVDSIKATGSTGIIVFLVVVLALLGFLFRLL